MRVGQLPWPRVALTELRNRAIVYGRMSHDGLTHQMRLTDSLYSANAIPVGRMRRAQCALDADRLHVDSKYTHKSNISKLARKRVDGKYQHIHRENSLHLENRYP